MAKSLVEQIVEIYPELSENNYKAFEGSVVMVQDDSDGQGAFIALWNYQKPLPAGMKIGK